MALNRPILRQILPFDATAPHIISFTFTESGTRIVANRLVIKRNDDLTVVFNDTQNTFSYTHNVPENTLENGVIYIAELYVIGQSGEASPASRPSLFRCLETPTFEFLNITDGQTLDGNSYNFSLTYNQSQNEPLNSVMFYLYGSSGQQLSQSPVLTNFGALTNTVSYLFSGFNDKTYYKIKAVGQTLNGMEIETDEISFVIKYSKKSTYSIFTVNNNCNGGYIYGSVEVKPIVGSALREPPTYIGDSEIDLTDGNVVLFPTGYEVVGDFNAKLWARNLKPNSYILEFSGENGFIAVDNIIDDGKFALRLTAKNLNNNIKYVIYSNQLNSVPSPTEKLFIQIRRVDNLYSITLAVTT